MLSKKQMQIEINKVTKVALETRAMLIETRTALIKTQQHLFETREILVQHLRENGQQRLQHTHRIGEVPPLEIGCPLCGLHQPHSAGTPCWCGHKGN